MSAVWVSTEEGGRGSLPARCAKTGERCITRVQLRTSDLPPALEWATWARLWPRTPSTPPVPVIVSLLPSVARVHYLLRRTRAKQHAESDVVAEWLMSESAARKRYASG